MRPTILFRKRADRKVQGLYQKLPRLFVQQVVAQIQNYNMLIIKQNVPTLSQFRKRADRKVSAIRTRLPSKRIKARLPNHRFFRCRGAMSGTPLPRPAQDGPKSPYRRKPDYTIVPPPSPYCLRPVLLYVCARVCACAFIFIINTA